MKKPETFFDLSHANIRAGNGYYAEE